MTPARPDTADMFALHRGLRREFDLMPGLVRAVAAGEHADAQRVAAHLEMELGSLHNHHAGEDAVLWPALLEAVRGPERELVDAMQAQHDELDVIVSSVHAARAAWVSDAAAAERDCLVDELARLAPALRDHLDDEETKVLPLVETHLTTEDWARLGQESRRRLPSSSREQLLLLGVLLEDATDHERAVIYAQMPTAARLGWHATGHPLYRRYVRRLRGAR